MGERGAVEGAAGGDGVEAGKPRRRAFGLGAFSEGTAMASGDDYRKMAAGALRARKGDCTNRARAAFSGLRDDQTDAQYGESGRTRREILQDFEREDQKIDEAIAWVMAAELPSPPSIAADLKEPAPGAVEGAEIEIDVTLSDGAIDQLRPALEKIYYALGRALDMDAPS